MTDLFLSYKAEDRPRVAPLVEALESDGLSVWWDAHIGGGDDWRDTILRHLEAAKCVIVVWSKRSVGPDGNFVRDEAGRAQKRKAYFPVRIDKVDPPLGFGETQALDLQGWKGDRSDARYQAVLGAIRKRAGIKAKAGPAAMPKQDGISRRAVIGGTAVAAVAAAGAGGWLLMRPAAAKADSIAVLPFANLSGDPGQAYFSDGIAEELRGALSRIAGLKVVARTSCEAVRNADAKTAARKLGVDNILTGSVRRSPETIRISAQLIDGELGTERWSDVYDRVPGDALLIQTDIADKVAQALSIRLQPADQRSAGDGSTNNSQAQDLLLKGRAYLEEHDGEEALQRATGLVEAALALDPDYGEAVAFKATLQMFKAGGYSSSAAESQRWYRIAETTARQAIALAPRSRAGYSTLAGVLDQQLHRRAALAEYRKLPALPGNDSDLSDYAVALSELGRSGEALTMIDSSIAADPLNARSYGWKAYIVANDRRFGDAIVAVNKMLEIRPSSVWGRSFHAYCQMMLGHDEKARAEFDAIGLPDSGGAPAYLGALAARQSDTALVDRVLTAMRRESSDAAHYQFAEIYAQQRRRDEALAALESAWVARDPGLTDILVDPLLDPVRSDPRFAALVKKLDFPT